MSATLSILTCPKCGAKNRVADRGDGVQPVCGRCKTPLTGNAAHSDAGHPITVTDATLASVLTSAGGRPVLVDCWAAWCGPCRMLAPTIDALARSSAGRYLIAKLDVDANPAVASKFRVSSIPTMLIFKSGALVDQIVGLQPQHAIEARLLSHA